MTGFDQPAAKGYRTIASRIIPRLVLAGTGSSCGKTTVTCAVLGTLAKRGVSLRAFKCGPDYIDPMFHTQVMGLPSRNLDSFLCEEETVRELFGSNTPDGSVAVIEGVMGLYDGLSGISTAASTYDIARILDAPVVLVCGCKGKSLTLAAELRGYWDFRQPGNIAGVILNGVSSHTYPMYKLIVEQHAGLEVLGYMPHMPEVELQSRKLGLVAAGEVDGLRQKLDKLAKQAENTINIDRLTQIAQAAPPLGYNQTGLPPPDETVRVAVARDKAFYFYYQDSLDVLKKLGVKLIAFSPLTDTNLPHDCAGLLLGGGYPELHAARLASNQPMLEALRRAVEAGVPTIAESGGFTLLCRSLTTADGMRHTLAGAIGTDIRMTERLTRFGYATLTANSDNLLCKAGEQLAAHCFHYSQADEPGSGFTAAKPGGQGWQTAYTSKNLYAGFPQLYLCGNIAAAQRFVEACMRYRKEARSNDA